MGSKWKDVWLGLIYDLQRSKRLEQGVEPSSPVSRRNCAHCLGAAEDGGHRFSRCSVKLLAVHRRDICKQFVPRGEGWGESTMLPSTFGPRQPIDSP